MASFYVTKWEAVIYYAPGRYIKDGEPETLIGTLRSLECFIRRVSDRITSVTLTPHTTFIIGKES